MVIYLSKYNFSWTYDQHIVTEFDKKNLNLATLIKHIITSLHIRKFFTKIFLLYLNKKNNSSETGTFWNPINATE